MPRVTLPEFIITVALLLGAAIGVSKLYQSFLVGVVDNTRVNMTKTRY